MAMVTEQAIRALGTVLLGKDRQIRLAVTCLLCSGHLLIEDLPGMGKTTLAHALAKVLGLRYARLQFTSDLLPSDLIGVNIYDPQSRSFQFHAGPLFNQIILADEINRASPKSQSALLEAMEERQLSIEGVTHALPAPFFVIATQNPAEQIGTFPLPESQMDRFFMRIHLGYPPPEAERRLLEGHDRREQIATMAAVLDETRLAAIQANIRRAHCSGPLLDYVQRLIACTRNDPGYGDGLSPRGALALLHAARGWACLHGREHVLPDDVQAVLPSVVEHRLGGSSRAGVHPLSDRLIKTVAIT